MTRIRPTAQDQKDAAAFHWLEQHWDMIDHQPWDRPDVWLVFVTDDPLDHEVAGRRRSLSDAVELARELEKKRLEEKQGA